MAQYPPGQKILPKYLDEGDIVYKINNNQVYFGTVVDYDHENENTNKKAEVFWIEKKYHEKIDINRIGLINRAIAPSDIVQKINRQTGQLDGMLGYCRNLKSIVTVQQIGSDVVLENIEQERLQEIQEFPLYEIISYGLWVGTVIKTTQKITCCILSRTMPSTPIARVEFLHQNSDNCFLQMIDTYDTDYSYRGCKHFVGESFYLSPSKFNLPEHFNVKWSSFNKKIKKSKKKHYFVIVDTKLIKVFVNWSFQKPLCGVKIDDFHKLNESPPFEIVGDEIKKLKLLRPQNCNILKLNERYKLKLNGQEQIISKSNWNDKCYRHYLKLINETSIDRKQSLDKQNNNKIEIEWFDSESNSLTQCQRKKSECDDDFEVISDSESEQILRALNDSSKEDDKKRTKKMNKLVKSFKKDKPLKLSKHEWQKTLEIISKDFFVTQNANKIDFVYVNVLINKTYATVVWQDGSVEENILSLDLVSIKTLDERDFLPGDFVHKLHSTTLEYGIIQKVNPVERTAIVKWFDTSKSPSEITSTNQETQTDCKVNGEEKDQIICKINEEENSKIIGEKESKTNGEKESKTNGEKKSIKIVCKINEEENSKINGEKESKTNEEKESKTNGEKKSIKIVCKINEEESKIDCKINEDEQINGEGKSKINGEKESKTIVEKESSKIICKINEKESKIDCKINREGKNIINGEKESKTIEENKSKIDCKINEVNKCKINEEKESKINEDRESKINCKKELKINVEKESSKIVCKINGEDNSKSKCSKVNRLESNIDKKNDEDDTKKQSLIKLSSFSNKIGIDLTIIPSEQSEDEVSVYDLKDHVDFNYRLGAIVINISEKYKFDCIVGEVIDFSITDGSIVVKWITDDVTRCWPQDLYQIGVYRGNEADLFPDDYFDHNYGSDDDDENYSQTNSVVYSVEILSPSDYEDDTTTWDTDSVYSHFGETNPDDNLALMKLIAEVRKKTRNPDKIDFDHIATPELYINIRNASEKLGNLQKLFTQDDMTLLNSSPACLTILKKLIEVYKDCRYLDRLMSTTFFDEIYFNMLVKNSNHAVVATQSAIDATNSRNHRSGFTDKIKHHVKKIFTWDISEDDPTPLDDLKLLQYENDIYLQGEEAKTNKKEHKIQRTMLNNSLDDIKLILKKNQHILLSKSFRDDDNEPHGANSTEIMKKCESLIEIWDKNVELYVELEEIFNDIQTKLAEIEQMSDECGAGQNDDYKNKINAVSCKIKYWMNLLTQNSQDKLNDKEIKTIIQKIGEIYAMSNEKLIRMMRNDYHVRRDMILSELEIIQNEAGDRLKVKFERNFKKQKTQIDAEFLQKTLNECLSNFNVEKIVLNKRRVTLDIVLKDNNKPIDCLKSNDLFNLEFDEKNESKESNQSTNVNSSSSIQLDQSVALKSQSLIETNDKSKLNSVVVRLNETNSTLSELSDDSISKSRLTTVDDSNQKNNLIDSCNSLKRFQKPTDDGVQILSNNDDDCNHCKSNIIDNFFDLNDCNLRLLMESICQSLRDRLNLMLNEIERYLMSKNAEVEKKLSDDDDLIMKNTNENLIDGNNDVDDDDMNVASNEQGFEILDIDPANHKFFHNTMSQQSVAFARAVRREHAILAKSLPPGVWVRAYSERLDLLTIMILGPVDTPYEDGLFVFDVLLPNNYPNKPPKFHYVSYCSERLNPNLYPEGKVCVSLLGTWTGSEDEIWSPNKSTLLQVIVSIQGLILNAEPYYNEAGYEVQKKTGAGHENSRKYNEMVTLKLVEHMSQMFTNPHEVFKNEISNHFKNRGQAFYMRMENILQYAHQNAFTEKNLPSSSESNEANSSNNNKLLVIENQLSIPKPNFPLMPASRGFCLSLSTLLNRYRGITDR